MAEQQQKAPDKKGVIVVYNQGLSSVGAMMKPPAPPYALECGANLVPVEKWAELKAIKPFAVHLTIPASVMPGTPSMADRKSLVEGPVLADGWAGAKEETVMEVIDRIVFVPLLKKLRDDERRGAVRQKLNERIAEVEKKVRKPVAA
jgi:hypothetical protein